MFFFGSKKRLAELEKNIMSKLQQTEDHTQDILRQQEVMHEQRWLSLRQTQRDITRRISNIDGVLVELGLAVAPPEDQKGGSWT